MNDTLNYYNQNALLFSAGTQSVNFSETQKRFLKLLTPGDWILDFGCGAGRDARYFLSEGYRVDAVDGSDELCKIASEYTGIQVRQMLFSELSEKEKYNGVWACSSILHLPHNELKSVIKNISEALKSGGIFYTSFKYGTFEGMRNGRFFSDFTEDTFAAFMKDIDTLEFLDVWITSDVRPGRNEEKWLNLIMRKI